MSGAPAAAPASRPYLGIALRIAAMVCFATTTALAKLTISRGLPILEVAFFRNLFALIPILLLVTVLRRPALLTTRRPGAHLLRGGLGLATVAFTFASVKHLPLNEATAIALSLPLFATILSALLLTERVPPRRWLAIAVGFIGMIVILRPDASRVVSIGAIYGITASIFGGAAAVMIRRLAATESGVTIAFFTTVVSALGLGLALPATWVAPSGSELRSLVLIGVCGGATQLLQTIALRFAPVALLMPFDYTLLIWSAVLSWTIWADLPTVSTLLGAALIVGSGLSIIPRRDARSRDRARAARPQAGTLS